MDTRTKIIPAATAAAATGRKVIASYFDVLKPGHVLHLQELARQHGRLVAIVLDPPDPLLSREARAELAAALDIIEFVVPAPPEQFCEWEFVPEDTAGLIRHIKERHGL